MEKNSYSLQRNTGLIGRYVIQKVLGQGGFGITYLGIDKLYGNKVAIKEYYPQKIAMRKAQYEDVVKKRGRLFLKRRLTGRALNNMRTRKKLRYKT